MRTMNMGAGRKAIAWALAAAALTSSLPLTTLWALASPAPAAVTAADEVFPQFGATPGHSFAPDVSGRGFNQTSLKWSRAIAQTTGSSVVANFTSDVRLNNTSAAPDVLGVVWGYPDPFVFGQSFVSIGAGNNGTLMWSYPLLGSIFATPVAADFNGDGRMDVVIRADNGLMQALTPNITWDGSNYLYPIANLTDLRAQQLWNISLSGSSSLDNNQSTPIAANLAGGPAPEILAPAGDRLYMIDGATGAELGNITVDGTIVSAPTVAASGGSFRVYVVSTNRSAANSTAVRSEYILTALDASLNFLWNATFYESYDLAPAYKSLDLQLPSPAAGDFDGGGTANDLALVTPYENGLAHLRIFYNGSNSPTVNVSLMGLTGAAPAAADLDGDGRTEIVALSYQPGTPISSPNSAAFVEVFNGNGTRRWNATIDEVQTLVRENTLAPPAVADLSGDGVKDVVVMLTDGSSEVRSGANGSRLLRHFFFDQGSTTAFSGPCVADLDRDGFLDITANAAAVSFSLADLSLNSSDITVNNTQPEQFEDVQVTATVHNHGNVLASNITVAFLDNGLLLNSSVLPVIIAGGTAQAQVTVNFTGGGARTLLVVADANNTVEEISETNNTATLLVTVNSLYGFTFTSPANRTAVQPGFSYVFILNAVSEGTENNTVNLSVGALPVNWTVSLSAVNLSLTAQGTPGDTNTSFLTVNTDVSASQGVYDIAVTGTSVQNPRNSARMVFSVIIGGQYGASLFPRTGAQNVTAGDTAVYTIEIINAGNSPDTFNFSTSPPPAGWTVTLTRATSPPLQPNGRTTFAVTVRSPTSSLQGDNATVVVTARSQNDTAKNDTATFTTTVVVPDLVVEDVRFFRACAGEAFQTSPSLITGESSRIQVTVRNAAQNAQVSSLRVRFWVEGTITDVPTVIAADGRGFANFSFTYTSAGPKSVIVTVDPGNLISELDENNNDLSDQVSVKDPAPNNDLSVVGTVSKGGAGVAGASVTVTNAARNTSAAVTAGPAGAYSVDFPAADFEDGDRLTVNATDGLDVGSATVCAYSEDFQVGADIGLSLPSPYDFLLTALGDTNATAKPGTVAIFGLRLTNRGALNNTILIAAVGTWSPRITDLNGTNLSAVLLPPNGSLELQAVVLVPNGTAPGVRSITAVNATAAADSTRARGMLLETSASRSRAVALALDKATGSGLAGTSPTVNMTVTNAGNGPENVTLTAVCTSGVDCSGWTTFAPLPIELGPGQSGRVAATIHVPTGATGGAYLMQFAAFTPDDPTVVDYGEFNLTVLTVRYEFTVSGPSQLRLQPGEARTANFTITNRGTVADTIKASTPTLGSGFSAALDDLGDVEVLVTLEPGASAPMTLTVGTPLEVDRESFIIDLLFESNTTGVQKTVTLNATIGFVYDFRLTNVRTPTSAEVGKEVQITVTVANAGQRAFTGQLIVRLLVGGTVYSTATITTLAVGEEQVVVFRWTPEATGDTNLTVDLNRGGGPTYFESSLTDNVREAHLVVTPASGGGFLAERGFMLFVLALAAVLIALVLVSKRRAPGAEAPEDEEKAQEESEERRKGKESGGLGRI